MKRVGEDPPRSVFTLRVRCRFDRSQPVSIEMGSPTSYEVTTISPSLRLSAEVISRFRDYCLAPGGGPPGPRPPAGAALIWPSSQCSSALPSTNLHMSKWVVVYVCPGLRGSGRVLTEATH